MIFIFNMKYGNLPEYLSNNLVYNRDVHNVNTRNRNNFRLPFYRTDQDQNNLYYKGLKLFNELPDDIKNCTSTNEFKTKLYQHTLLTPIR